VSRYKVIFLFICFPLITSSVSSLQYDGVKLEIMNVENTNFYGLGIFTSDGRFDASAEFLLATKWFAQNSSLNLIDNNYPLYFFSFNADFHIVRSATYTFSIGTGIMPLFLDHYILHAALTFNHYFDDNFRIFFSMKKLINNAGSLKYPTGFANSVGFKYGF
jgi:hypothetical protein